MSYSNNLMTASRQALQYVPKICISSVMKNLLNYDLRLLKDFLNFNAVYTKNDCLCKLQIVTSKWKPNSVFFLNYVYLRKQVVRRYVCKMAKKSHDQKRKERIICSPGFIFCPFFPSEFVSKNESFN